jgi:hypothetical protein
MDTKMPEWMAECIKDLMEFSLESKACCSCVHIMQKNDGKHYCTFFESVPFPVLALSSCKRYQFKGKKDNG